jgi:hypothetical protein
MNQRMERRLGRMETKSADKLELFPLLRESVQLGLQRAIEVLRSPPDPLSEHYQAILSAQIRLTNGLIGALARAGEMRAQDESKREETIRYLLSKIPGRPDKSDGSQPLND